MLREDHRQGVGDDGFVVYHQHDGPERIGLRSYTFQSQFRQRDGWKVLYFRHISHSLYRKLTGFVQYGLTI